MEYAALCTAGKSMKEKKSSIAIFLSDLEKVKGFYAKHPAEFQSLADALRVIVEYCDAHGVLK